MRLTEMNTKPSATKINKVMESRFGNKIDFANLDFGKAYNLANALTESLDKIKNSHGIHKAEQNPKYMQFLLVREGIHNWMIENKDQLIQESEMGRSQAILAAKDMVDSVQDMLEDVSEMANEQMPALLDTIRDQIGMTEAENFKGSVGGILETLQAAISSSREQMDMAARALAGEQVDQPMDMAVDAQAGMAPPVEAGEVDVEVGDEFDATEPAAGPDAIGRATRD
jgi:hypothetical protein